METWESIGTPEISEFNCKGQNTLHRGVINIIGKLLKRRCRKWVRMGHLDICSTSYGKKKGRESNWQFDSRPLKVGNRPNPGVCRWNATHRWKALDESYKFALDLILIGGLNKELWLRKVAGIQTGTVSRLFLGSPGIKTPLGYRCHGEVQRIIYGGRWWLPRVRAVVSLVSPELPMVCLNTKGALENELTNLLVGLMQVRISE
jgi:hypothetical protein